MSDQAGRTVAPRRTDARASARFSAVLAAVACLFAASSRAAPIDLTGPAGSVAFGHSVTVLPNSNFVVVDAGAQGGIGAVYLYSPALTVISTLTGTIAGDSVGSGGVAVVGNGNFVVLSPSWNGAATAVGAATWVDGALGLNGSVSTGNSLVGASQSDNIGSGGVINLANGNYIIKSPNWHVGVSSNAGAVTWANGNAPVTGTVGSAYSLVGSSGGDNVGYYSG